MDLNTVDLIITLKQTIEDLTTDAVEEAKEYTDEQLATKQDALTFDDTPTEGSTNPVTSDGIKAYVDENGGGTEVIANPSDEATETLSTISIDGTVYQVVTEKVYDGEYTPLPSVEEPDISLFTYTLETSTTRYGSDCPIYEAGSLVSETGNHMFITAIDDTSYDGDTITVPDTMTIDDVEYDVYIQYNCTFTISNATTLYFEAGIKIYNTYSKSSKWTLTLPSNVSIIANGYYMGLGKILCSGSDDGYLLGYTYNSYVKKVVIQGSYIVPENASIPASIYSWTALTFQASTTINNSMWVQGNYKNIPYYATNFCFGQGYPLTYNEAIDGVTVGDVTYDITCDKCLEFYGRGGSIYLGYTGETDSFFNNYDGTISTNIIENSTSYDTKAISNLILLGSAFSGTSTSSVNYTITNLYLLNPAIVTLTSAMQTRLLAKATNIYVPSDLLESYQTTYSSYSSNFIACPTV